MTIDREILEEWRDEVLRIKTYRENKWLRRLVELTEELLEASVKERRKEHLRKLIEIINLELED